MNGFIRRIPEVNSWLLAAVFFCIPIQVAPAFILTFLMLVLFVLEGRFKEKLNALRAEPLVWIFLVYYLVFLLSLAWTKDMTWGWRMVGKQIFFLLSPLYFLVARREHLPRYLAAFLLSIVMCEALAYYNFFHLNFWPWLPEGIRVDKDPNDTAPFVDRILYSPALALAAYILAHQVFFGHARRGMKALYVVLFLATAGNLLFSGGRSGLLGFLVLILLLAFQRFARRPALAGILASALISLFLLGGYLSNDYFRSRIDIGISDIRNFETNPNTSLGQRFVFVMNSWRLFVANPVGGVGAGDFPDEYEKVNQRHTPSVRPIWNPHNQYTYALAHTGIAGGILLLLVLFYPLFRRGTKDGREHMRVALPVLLMTICLVESYLMRSNTSMMYVLFTAALWCGDKRIRS